MIWWIIIGIVALLLIRWLLKFRRLLRCYVPKHFTEFAISLAAAVSAARKDMQPPEEGGLMEDDDRFFRTTAGMWLFYTIQQQNGGFLHSFIFGMNRGRMWLSLGEDFTIYSAKLLGINFKRMKIHYTTGNVFHNTFFLTHSQQRRFDQRMMPIYTTRKTPEILKECQQLTPELKYKYVPMKRI